MQKIFQGALNEQALGVLENVKEAPPTCAVPYRVP